MDCSPVWRFEKIRGIIGEWATGVKRKISLSFKGIMAKIDSTEGSGDELWIDVHQMLTHGGAEGHQFICGRRRGLQNWLGNEERKTGVRLDLVDGTARGDGLQLEPPTFAVQPQDSEGRDDFIQPSARGGSGRGRPWTGDKIDVRHERARRMVGFKDDHTPHHSP